MYAVLSQRRGVGVEDKSLWLSKLPWKIPDYKRKTGVKVTIGKREKDAVLFESFIQISINCSRIQQNAQQIQLGWELP